MLETDLKNGFDLKGKKKKWNEKPLGEQLTKSNNPVQLTPSKSVTWHIAK